MLINKLNAVVNLTFIKLESALLDRLIRCVEENLQSKQMSVARSNSWYPKNRQNQFGQVPIVGSTAPWTDETTVSIRAPRKVCFILRSPAQMSRVLIVIKPEQSSTAIISIKRLGTMTQDMAMSDMYITKFVCPPSFQLPVSPRAQWARYPMLQLNPPRPILLSHYRMCRCPGPPKHPGIQTPQGHLQMQYSRVCPEYANLFTTRAQIRCASWNNHVVSSFTSNPYESQRVLAGQRTLSQTISLSIKAFWDLLEYAPAINRLGHNCTE